MDIAELDVAVAGAAIGGSAAALLLARAGARVTLFERASHPLEAGAGLGLAENGLAVLERLGLHPAIEAASCEVGTGRVVSGSGRLLFEAPPPAPRVRMMRRRDLQRVLLDAIAGEPRITRQFGVEVVSADAGGRVLARRESDEFVWTGDLVIGADGVHSRVRQTGRFGVRQTPGLTYMRALVDADVARCEEAWTSRGLFGSFPVPGGTYVYASAAEGEEASGNLPALCAAWSRAYAPAGEMLTHVRAWDDLIFSRVVRVDCERWVDGRVALVGDAAHAMAPNLGQGANSALVDAAVLLDELQAGDTLPRALDAWQTRRQPKVRAVADLAARLGGLAEITNPLLRTIRDHVLPPLVRMFGTRDTGAMVLQESPARLRLRS